MTPYRPFLLICSKSSANSVAENCGPRYSRAFGCTILENERGKNIMRTQKSTALTAAMLSALVLGAILQAGTKALMAQATKQPSTPSTSGQSAHDTMPGMQ